MFRKKYSKAVAVTLWAAALIILITIGTCRRRLFEKPTPGLKTLRDNWIRVLLFDNIEDCTLEYQKQMAFSKLSELKITGKPANNNQDRQKLTWRKLPASNTFKLSIIKGKFKINDLHIKENFALRDGQPGIITLNGNRYRGQLEFFISEDGKTFDVVNTLPVEAYLAGVVGAEMPTYWNIEALKAQAVAARTYALYIKKRFGKNRHYDVRKTQANQVYRGIRAESPRVWTAVTETEAMVLTYCEKDDGGKNSDKENNDCSIFPTYYHSTCGGHTENAENVFGRSHTPLKAVKCPYCRKTTRKSFFSWDTVSYDIDEISEKLLTRYPYLRRLEKIIDVKTVGVSCYEDLNRVVSVELYGQKGRMANIRAEDFRLVVDPTGSKIKSAAFDLERKEDKLLFKNGRGYGHGVGMCQYGALGLAKRDRNCIQILNYYYPGSIIKTFDENKPFDL